MDLMYYRIIVAITRSVCDLFISSAIQSGGVEIVKGIEIFAMKYRGGRVDFSTVARINNGST